MLHLRNQQLYARENRIPRPSPIERRTVAQSPAERFSLSIFSPRSRTPLLHTIAPFPRLISDHGSSFVRNVMGVPLLSGREHAREKTMKKRAFASSSPSPSTPHPSLGSISPSSPCRSFFQSLQVFGLRAASLSMQSPLPAPVRLHVPPCSSRNLSHRFESRRANR